MPDSAREFLEPRLQANLDGVRVHTNTSAGSLARAINARAFTQGQDIYFAPGEFRPKSSAGMRLLAHEVVHTLQDKEGGRTSQPSVVRRAPPDYEEPNSLYKELLDAQTSLNLNEDARAIISEAQNAINMAFYADSDRFSERMQILNELLSNMQIRLANAEERDQHLMKVRDAGVMSASDQQKLFDAEAARLAAHDLAFGPERGIGFWLWPTQYQDRLLVGMYDREGKLPTTTRDSEGIGEWIAWLTSREVELSDLLERADEIVIWAKELSTLLPEQEPFASNAYAAAIGTPASLARSTGREYQYLTELMRDHMPAWFVDHYARDLTTLRIESEAHDAGISVARLRELDQLIVNLGAEREAMAVPVGSDPELQDLNNENKQAFIAEQQLRDLIALPKNDRAYVFRRLRADEKWAYMVSVASEETLEQLEAAGKEIGMNNLGAEGFHDTYTAGDMAWDMVKATPGGTLNVAYGMVISVPIVGDMVNRAAGEHVNNFSDSMNKSLGIDEDWAKTQREVGQTFGKVAGTIGLAGVAGIGSANVSVFGKTLSLSANVRHTTLGADLVHNGWRVVTGRSTALEELSTRDRVLSGVGLVISGVGVGAGKQAQSSRTITEAKDWDLTWQQLMKGGQEYFFGNVSPTVLSRFNEAAQAASTAHESLTKAETLDSLLAKTGAFVGSSGSAFDLWNYCFGDAD